MVEIVEMSWYLNGYAEQHQYNLGSFYYEEILTALKCIGFKDTNLELPDARRIQSSACEGMPNSAEQDDDKNTSKLVMQLISYIRIDSCV